jgi:hypothetical protein
MSKTLVLKPRLSLPNGGYAWHDKVILGNAINNIGKNKSLMDLSLWIGVAGKIEAAAEEAGFGKLKKTDKKIKVRGEGGKIEEIEQELESLPEFKVEIRNKEAELLWKELKELKFEDYYPQMVCRKCGAGQASIPNVGLIYQMFVDIAACLEEKMPESEED